MKLKKFVFAAMLSTVASVANASLIGDTVHIAQNYPTIGSEFYSTNAVVGAGTEFSWPMVLSIDVGANTVDITFENIGFVDIPSGGNNHNGPIISGLNDSMGNLLSGFSGFLTNTVFPSSNIIWGGDYIGFNFDGMRFSSGQSIHVDLNFGPQNNVPEPVSLSLLGVGLAALALARRQRA